MSLPHGDDRPEAGETGDCRSDRCVLEGGLRDSRYGACALRHPVVRVGRLRRYCPDYRRPATRSAVCSFVL
jgi:hypothetical protein